MATRSRIGLELSDGSVLSAYHHWDGYPEWLGRILSTHYNSKEIVAELIDGGDMSSCWTDSIQYSEEGRTGEYNYYSPEYYSARGEDCPPRLDADLCDYLLAINAEEYHYLFRNGEWVCYEMNPLGNELPKVVEIPSGALAV
jgi:hypothetical protein